MPLVARTCPNVPVALFESRSSPVICNLEIVVEARTAKPVTFNLLVVAFVAVRLVIVEVPIVAFVAVKLVKNAFSEESNVAKKLPDVVAFPVTVRLLIVVVAKEVFPFEIKLAVNKLVEVELVAIKFVVEAFVDTRSVVVALTAVKLDILATVLVRLVTVPDAEIKLFIFPLVMVVVAKVEVPATERVPVAEMLPVFKLEIEALPKLVLPVTVRLLIVVVARVEVPKTVKVP